MTRTEFIKEIRELADKLEQGNYHFINFGKDEGTYLFANRNYGEISVQMGDARIGMTLYTATMDEQKEFDN